MLLVGGTALCSGALERVRKLYTGQLNTRPVLTKAWSAFLLGTLSNLVASFNALRVQANTQKRRVGEGQLDGVTAAGHLQWSHFLRAMKYGAMNAPPYSHYWYVNYLRFAAFLYILTAWHT